MLLLPVLLIDNIFEVFMLRYWLFTAERHVRIYSITYIKFYNLLKIFHRRGLWLYTQDVFRSLILQIPESKDSWWQGRLSI